MSVRIIILTFEIDVTTRHRKYPTATIASTTRNELHLHVTTRMPSETQERRTNLPPSNLKRGPLPVLTHVQPTYLQRGSPPVSTHRDREAFAGGVPLAVQRGVADRLLLQHYLRRGPLPARRVVGPDEGAAVLSAADYAAVGRPVVGGVGFIGGAGGGGGFISIGPVQVCYGAIVTVS